MRMLMIICPQDRETDVRRLIAQHDVHAYSEISSVIGEGATGKKFGTHTFPQTSTLIFTIVPPEKDAELEKALREFASGLYPSEGLRVFALQAEPVI